MYPRKIEGVRPTAKIIAIDDDGRVPLCVGKTSGRLNLLGGGVDNSETIQQALARGFYEETKMNFDDVVYDTKFLGNFITDELCADWYVHVGRLTIPAYELTFDPNEIAGIQPVTLHKLSKLLDMQVSPRYEKFLLNRPVSMMAVSALQLAHETGQLEFASA